MGDVITVQLKWREQQCAIDIDTSITVGDLREVVAIEVRTAFDPRLYVCLTVAQTNIEPKCQRLVYSGRVLKDEEILSAVGIRNNHSIYVVYASPASPAPSTPAASPPRPAPTSAPSPFGSPFGWPGSTAGGMPQAGSAGSFDNLQQQLLNDPNLMRQVTESPIMQYMMDNPELMRSMMMANPQMQAVIEQNPEVGHALNDPATLRQMMQLVRNPDLMLEMQRNADRAMQHIEVMPGGFNALRRMYEGVSSPMEEAARSQLGGTEHANTAFTALRDNSAPPPADRPNDVALPNPWGPLPPATPQAPAASRQPFCGGGGNPFFGAGGSPGMSQMLSDPNMNAMIQSMMSDPAAMEGVRSALLVVYLAFAHCSFLDAATCAGNGRR